MGKSDGANELRIDGQKLLIGAESPCVTEKVTAYVTHQPCTSFTERNAAQIFISNHARLLTLRAASMNSSLMDLLIYKYINVLIYFLWDDFIFYDSVFCMCTNAECFLGFTSEIYAK